MNKIILSNCPITKLSNVIWAHIIPPPATYLSPTAINALHLSAPPPTLAAGFFLPNKLKKLLDFPLDSVDAATGCKLLKYSL